MLNTFAGLGPTPQTFYDRNLLSRAMPLLALAMFAQKRNLRRNSGNQISFRRYNKLATITTPLTEGVTPAGQALDTTEITATTAQYGGYVTITDHVSMTHVDPVLIEATDIIGEQAGESIEEIMRTELVTGTSVSYSGTGNTARGDVAAADVLTSDDVRGAIETLHINNARPFRGERNNQGMGGLYMGYVHPAVWYDYIGDTKIETTLQYSDHTKMYSLELPVFDQVAWHVSTFAPVFTGAGTGSIDVYGTFIFGAEAFGVVDVAGTGRFRTIVKPIGSGGTSDPLDQRGTTGWKAYQVTKILNNNFFTRIESAGV